MSEKKPKTQKRRYAREPKAATNDGAAKTKSKAKAKVDAASTSPKRETKIGKVIAMLRRKDGATLDEMVAATGWQPHSTRAAMTGLKKKGHSIERSKRGEVSCYRITASA